VITAPPRQSPLAVKASGAAGGVVITSSTTHGTGNGVKFKAKFGGSATPAIMKVIEDEVRVGAMPNGRTAPIEEVDLKQAYIRAVCRFADLGLIAKSEFYFCARLHVRLRPRHSTNIFEERGIPHIAIRQG